MSTYYKQIVKYFFCVCLTFTCFFYLWSLQGSLDKDYLEYQWHSNSINQYPKRLKAIIPSKYHSFVGELYWLKLIEFTYDPLFKQHEPEKNLFRLFNIITILEPHILWAYKYTLFIFGTMSPINYPTLNQDKLMVLNKGIKSFPHHWLFYHEKALIYKLAYKNAKKAAEIMFEASFLPNAPAPFNILAFYFALDTQNYSSLKSILDNLDKKTKTPEEKQFLRLNRAWLMSVIDRQRLTNIVEDYKKKHNIYPIENWKKLTTKIVMELPLFGVIDPLGYEYRLNRKNGKIQLDPASPLQKFDLIYKYKTHEKKYERH